MKEKIGDAPIQEETRDFMNRLAESIDMGLNGADTLKKDKEWGFLVLVFPFGKDGRANYISNARREEVIALMKEQIARFEGRYVEPKKKLPA